MSENTDTQKGVPFNLASHAGQHYPCPACQRAIEEPRSKLRGIRSLFRFKMLLVLIRGE